VRENFTRPWSSSADISEPTDFGFSHRFSARHSVTHITVHDSNSDVYHAVGVCSGDLRDGGNNGTEIGPGLPGDSQVAPVVAILTVKRV
jgi:hypothetical protein